MREQHNFQHPVYHNGEILAWAPFKEDADRMMIDISELGKGWKDLEVVTPPPPATASGIPIELLERNEALVDTLQTIVLRKDMEEGIKQVEEIKKWGSIVSRSKVGNDVYLYVRRNS